MGNLSFIIPTKNFEDYNKDRVYSMLNNEFPDLDVIDKGEDSLSIYNGGEDKIENLVCSLLFNFPCTLIIARSEDEMNEIDVQLKEKFDELGVDLENVIAMTYGWELLPLNTRKKNT